MANIKSAKKRAKQTVVRNARNAAQRSMLRTAVKKVLKALDANDAAGAKAAFDVAQPILDRFSSRGLIHKTAWELDRSHHMDVTDRVSMCNYRANRLCCEAADQAIQVHGGIGYTRHKPFEHIYRHHRRYRITEGSEEIQIRRVAGILFGRQAKR